MSYRDHGNIIPTDTRMNSNRQPAEIKSVASQNALETTLTGRTVLLPANESDRYQSHVQAYLDELTPTGQRETFLTQSVADAEWRLERNSALEMATYAKGRALLANNYNDEPEGTREFLIDLDVNQYYERELRNFQRQDVRLRRQRDRDLGELRFLQAERRRLIEERQALAAYAYQQAKTENKPFDPNAFGFVFSIAEIENFIALRKARRAIAAERLPLSVARAGRTKAA